MLYKRSFLFLGLLVVILLAAGLEVTFAAKQPQKGGTLKIAAFGEPKTLNPIMAEDSVCMDIIGFMYSALLKFDKNTNIIPDMAASLPKISKDNKQITFKLRKGIKWHDGMPLTSADVKFSYELIIDKNVNSPRYSDFEKIAKIETPDKYTVIFKLKEADSSIYYNFAFPYIIPKHIWEKEDRTKLRESKYSRMAIGNGPFKLKEWNNSERVVLEANPFFYGKKPRLAKVIFDITPSIAVAMVKAENQEDDMVEVPESDIARMRKIKHLNVYQYTAPIFDGIIYNTKSPFFSDKRVRQAISYAINKQVIIKGIYKGIGKPANGSYVPALWCYNPNVRKYNYNPALAGKLLDAAGWKMGKDGIREKNGRKFRVEMITNKGNTQREKVVVALQQQLKLVGIDIVPRILEWNTMFEKYIDRRNFDVYMGGFVTGIDGDQSVFYNSDPAKGFFNKGSYVNHKIDKLFAQMRKTFNRNEQKKYLFEVQKIVAEDQPITFLVYRENAEALNKRVKNVKVYDLLGLSSPEEWYVVP